MHKIMHMKLFSELYRQFFEEGETEVARIQYAVIDGRGGYFQNVKKIVEFTPQKIVFAGKKGTVAVEGENLSLGRYFGGDVTVYGKVFCVSAQVTQDEKML